LDCVLIAEFIRRKKMPTAVDRLTKDSSDEAIDEAVSACIATEVRGGRDQKQAIAMCYSMAREKTGKGLKPKGKRYPTMKG